MDTKQSPIAPYGKLAAWVKDHPLFSLGTTVFAFAGFIGTGQSMVDAMTWIVENFELLLSSKYYGLVQLVTVILVLWFCYWIDQRVYGRKQYVVRAFEKYDKRIDLLAEYLALTEKLESARGFAIQARNYSHDMQRLLKEPNINNAQEVSSRIHDLDHMVSMVRDGLGWDDLDIDDHEGKWKTLDWQGPINIEVLKKHIVRSQNLLNEVYEYVQRTRKEACALKARIRTLDQ